MYDSVQVLQSCVNAIVLLLTLRNIINEGFKNMITLPDSDEFDCVTCTCIADVDWDGNNEIVLGTYGQVGGEFEKEAQRLNLL